VKVEVIFDVDGNRNLTVTAREDSTGSFIKARITEDWLSKINYDDLPSQYKAPSEGGNIQMEELMYSSIIKPNRYLVPLFRPTA
jgi:hypothetical protein